MMRQLYITFLWTTGLIRVRIVTAGQTDFTYMPISQTMPTASSDERSFASTSHEWRTVSPNDIMNCHYNIDRGGRWYLRGSGLDNRIPYAQVHRIAAADNHHDYLRNLQLWPYPQPGTSILRDHYACQYTFKVALGIFENGCVFRSWVWVPGSLMPIDWANFT